MKHVSVFVLICGVSFWVYSLYLYFLLLYPNVQYPLLLNGSGSTLTHPLLTSVRNFLSLCSTQPVNAGDQTRFLNARSAGLLTEGGQTLLRFFLAILKRHLNSLERQAASFHIDLPLMHGLELLDQVVAVFGFVGITIQTDAPVRALSGNRYDTWYVNNIDLFFIFRLL